MYSLSVHVILDIWEQGHNQHALDRALTMLSPVFPGKTRDELARLSLGVRDEHLLKMRELNFGQNLAGTTSCPSCSERLEFSIKTSEILSTTCSVTSDEKLNINIDQYQIDYRLPNSHDLACIVKGHDLSKGRSFLIEQCIVKSKCKTKLIAPTALPDKIIEQLGQEIERADPNVETLLKLTCSECEHDWSINLDINAFLWTEIAASAKRLLQDIHFLALAYGWTEHETLKLSAFRRRQYLEMIG